MNSVQNETPVLCNRDVKQKLYLTRAGHICWFPAKSGGTAWCWPRRHPFSKQDTSVLRTLMPALWYFEAWKWFFPPYARGIDSTKVIKPVSLEVKEFVWVPPNLSILKQWLVCTFHFFVSWPHNLIHVGLKDLNHENEVTMHEVGMTRLFKTLEISGFWMSKCAML